MLIDAKMENIQITKDDNCYAWNDEQEGCKEFKGTYTVGTYSPGKLSVV